MALSQAFMDALLEGHLAPLRIFLCRDRSLCPELRDGTLSVYYRGGRLLKLKESNGTYKAAFDRQYARGANEPWVREWISALRNLPQVLKCRGDVAEWLACVPVTKAVMDDWFYRHGGLERESQQLVVQENNRDDVIARATDYFFCDMETAENQHRLQGRRQGLRFDLVGVHWPSRSNARRQAKDRQLVVAEVKHGDGAYSNLGKHYKDILALVRSDERLAALKQTMLGRYSQKHRLGFISQTACRKPLESFSSGPVIWMLILINHDPESRVLGRWLNKLSQVVETEPEAKVRVRVGLGNFMGYGLWDEAVVDLAEFVKSNHSRIGNRGI